MNIGVIGSGGREHALCFKLSQSERVNKIYCFPGNAGTKNIATNVSISADDFGSLYQFVKKESIELIIVGPEIPLVNGIVDFFESKNIKIFGPNKKAAQLEGSKIFMKNLCSKFNIPTANFSEVKNLKEIESFLNNSNFPVVVKSDGLASGKGVTICSSREEVKRDVEKIFKGKFKSSKKVILEEFLDGEEASYFVLTDGMEYLPIGTAQDHKKIGEGDKGPNTGGMGAYSPSNLITTEIEKKICKNIIEPTLKGMREIGCPFKGVLYAGLMIKNNNPKLIEYNIRFGDPECQVLMMRLKDDLLELILACFNNSIKNLKINWSNKKSITIVGASKGYPEKYKKKVLIKNLEVINNNNRQYIFHAGTINDEKGRIITNGGRVLNSTALSANLKDARDIALRNLDNLDWENKYYRRDIGFRAIDE